MILTRTERRVLRRLERFGQDDGVRVNQGMFKDFHRTISVLDSLVAKGLVKRVYYLPDQEEEGVELEKVVKAQEIDWSNEDYEAMCRFIFQAMRDEGWRPEGSPLK